MKNMTHNNDNTIKERAENKSAIVKLDVACQLLNAAQTPKAVKKANK